MLAVALMAAGWLAAAGMAEGCSFCGAARKDASIAYVVTAAGMGLMPIAFGAGLVLWLRRKYRRAGENAGGGEDAAPPHP